MSACRRGRPIFILKTAFKNINQAQQNDNIGFWAEAPKILTVFSIVITQHGLTTHLTVQKFRHMMMLSTYLGALLIVCFEKVQLAIA